MTPRYALPALALGILCLNGCTLFKKSDRPKESSAISSEIEEGFRLRWVGQRSAELVAQGIPAETARAQAESEFSDRFGYTRAGRR